METVYKCKTTVGENGSLHIPDLVNMASQKVEVIVRSLTFESVLSERVVREFIDRGEGALEGFDPDKLKLANL